MTMSRLDALQTYWAKNPPVHQLIAAYLGAGQEAEKPLGIEDFMRAVGG